MSTSNTSIFTQFDSNQASSSTQYQATNEKRQNRSNDKINTFDLAWKFASNYQFQKCLINTSLCIKHYPSSNSDYSSNIDSPIAISEQINTQIKLATACDTAEIRHPIKLDG
eukprot:299496_1